MGGFLVFWKALRFWKSWLTGHKERRGCVAALMFVTTSSEIEGSASFAPPREFA